MPRQWRERLVRIFHDSATRAYVNDEHSDWDEYVEEAVSAMNYTIHASTLHTPFFLMHGSQPNSPLDQIIPRLYNRDRKTSPQYAEEQVEKLATAHEVARLRHAQSM